MYGDGVGVGVDCQVGEQQFVGQWVFVVVGQDQVYGDVFVGDIFYLVFVDCLLYGGDFVGWLGEVYVDWIDLFDVGQWCW